MKKAFSDVKSFVTIVFTAAFVVFTFLKITSGEQFYSLLQIIIAFYFGTQHEKYVKNNENNNIER